MFRRHPFLSAVTLVYLAAVGWITLGPGPLDPDTNGLLVRLLRVLQRYPSTDWITYNVVEFTANVLMFFPIGVFFLLLFGRTRWWLAILLGVALTCAIEFTQLFLPGRVSDPRDLLANSVGAAAGVLAGLVLTVGSARRARTPRRLATRASR